MTSFIDKFPILRTILSKSKRPSNDWDFFMTVAGVGIYFLTNKTNEEEANKIARRLSEIDRQMPEAMDNFFNYIEKGKKAGVSLTADIGYWVLWNTMGDEPTLEECTELAPAIGIFLMKVVSDFSN
jgi:23S rRNA A2030 N6-methylase RlmJ